MSDQPPFDPLPAALVPDFLCFVYENASKGDPQSVLRAIDRFSEERYFLINIGADKGAIVDKVLTDAKPKVMIELGGFIGYSAIRFGAMIRQFSEDARYYSFEINETYAGYARELIEFAGLSDTVAICLGHSSETISTFQAKFGIEQVDAILIDHRKGMYLPDLKLLEKHHYFRPGTVILADNVVIPGVPDYVSYIRSKPDTYKSHMETHEALIPGGRGVDGVEISVVLKPI